MLSQADMATGATIITINKAGYYKLELTALVTQNKFKHNIEVFKKSTGASTCDHTNSIILQLYAKCEQECVSSSSIYHKFSKQCLSVCYFKSCSNCYLLLDILWAYGYLTSIFSRNNDLTFTGCPKKI